MSHIYDFDHLNTDSYTPRISLEPTTPGSHIRPYVNVETRRFHEGRIVDPSLAYHIDITYYLSRYMIRMLASHQ